jgi:hypothetical protein
VISEEEEIEETALMIYDAIFQDETSVEIDGADYQIQKTSKSKVLVWWSVNDLLESLVLFTRNYQRHDYHNPRSNNLMVRTRFIIEASFNNSPSKGN